MLASHLLRMISVCLNGDYQDPAVRNQIKQQCIPHLSQHRREVLAGTYAGRHLRPAGFISNKIAGTLIIRQALAHAHRNLVELENSNVLSFAAAALSRSTASATA